MKRILSIIFLCFLISPSARAGDINNYHTGELQILTDFSEEDGSPIVYAPYKVKVPNATVTDNADGTVSLDYINETKSDVRYVNETGDTMEGVLDHAGYDVQFRGTSIRWETLNNETLNLYVGSVLAHQWTASSAASYLLLSDGSSFALLSDGASKIIIIP